MQKKLLRTLSYSLLCCFIFILSRNCVRQLNLQKRVILSNQPKLKLENPKFNSGIEKENKQDRLDENFVFTEDEMLDDLGNPYTIILWSHRQHGKPGYLANPKVCLANISCEITHERSRLDSAHAVVFSGSSPVYDAALDRHRKNHQIFAFREQESPLHGRGPSEPRDYYYNMTFHYRTDADVYAPYGSIHLILQEIAGDNDDIDALMRRKSDKNKVAVWAVSNCYAKRIRFAKSLAKSGLKVDFFGGCFNRRNIGGGRYSKSFYDEISKYKFYFAFENSISCKDYMTEKFWFNGLRSGAVPVVWGPTKEDVLKVAPSHSFIHADDFATPQDLADYLNYLDSNDYAYRKYLAWREWGKHPELIEERLKLKNRKNDLRSFCLLCAYVQQIGKLRKAGQSVPSKVVKSAKNSWLREVNGGSCHQ